LLRSKRYSTVVEFSAVLLAQLACDIVIMVVTTPPKASPVGYWCTTEGDSKQILIIRSTFIDSQKVCDHSKRSASAPPTCNATQERPCPHLLPYRNLEAGYAPLALDRAAQVDNGIKGDAGNCTLVSFPSDEIDQRNQEDFEQIITSGEEGDFTSGQYGSFQTDLLEQHKDNQDQETMSTQSQDSLDTQQPMDALQGSLMGPSWSAGSASHYEGSCKPCAWFWKRGRGCTRGALCGYCHLCGEGELKVRRRYKTKGMKDEER